MKSSNYLIFIERVIYEKNQEDLIGMPQVSRIPIRDYATSKVILTLLATSGGSESAAPIKHVLFWLNPDIHEIIKRSYPY